MNDLYTNFNTSTNKRATTQTRVTQTHSLTLAHTRHTHQPRATISRNQHTDS